MGWIRNSETKGNAEGIYGPGRQERGKLVLGEWVFASDGSGSRDTRNVT